MKPSERIKELKKWEGGNVYDDVSAIIEYLDEEYEKRKGQQ